MSDYYIEWNGSFTSFKVNIYFGPKSTLAKDAACGVERFHKVAPFKSYANCRFSL